MVAGHSACPSFIKDFFNLFHMPLFFFVSGFLLKDKYFDNPKKFIIQRYKGLYIPFIKWSLIFLLAHNFFHTIHLYDTYYSWSDYKVMIIKIFTLRGTEQLLGGFWFLRELLLCSLFCFAVLYLQRKIYPNMINKEKKHYIILIFSILTISLVVSEISFLKTTTLNRTILASAIFLTGFLFKKSSFGQKNNIFIAIGCLAGCFLTSFLFTSDMTIVQGPSLVLYFILSIIGCIGIINLSGCISGQLQVFLDYIGTRTLDILTFHFIAFKIISLAKISQYQLDITRLSDFPIIKDYNTFYWIFYIVAGISIPILIQRMLDGTMKAYNNLKHLI